MYVFLGLLMTTYAIIELGGRGENKRIFKIFIVILTSILVMRYGQGSDYYGYYLQYSRVNKDFSLFVNSLYHGELGWYIIIVIAKRMGMNFEIFIGIISAIMMYSIEKSIEKFSPYGVTSLILLYPTFYLTYCFSAIRQGLVMGLFLGFGLKLLFEKKLISYYILTILLVFFHKSALVLLLLPIICNIKKNKAKFCIFLLIFIGSMFLGKGMLKSVDFVNGAIRYLKVSISVMAILLRSILFYIVYKLHKENTLERKKVCAKDEIEDTLYYIYVFGYIMFISLSFTSTLSQRVTMPLKATEILLIPILIKNYNNKIYSRILHFNIIKIGGVRILASAMCILAILNIEVVKNIYSYIEQGNYYSWVNPINYPYSTIFNKEYIKEYLSHFDDEVD